MLKVRSGVQHFSRCAVETIFANWRSRLLSFGEEDMIKLRGRKEAAVETLLDVFPIIEWHC